MCSRRIDAKPDGCQLDLIVLSELVASEEVRLWHHRVVWV